MTSDPTRHLPNLVNVTVEPPPRHPATRDRRADADDLPLLATQTAEERQIAISLGVRVSAAPPPPGTEQGLAGRPYRLLPGRALSIRPGLITARKLILVAEA